MKIMTGVSLRPSVITAFIIETYVILSGPVTTEWLVRESPIIVPAVVSVSYMPYSSTLTTLYSLMFLTRNYLSKWWKKSSYLVRVDPRTLFLSNNIKGFILTRV